METFQEVINSKQPVLVDFHATWCGPCKQMAPELQRFAQNNKDKLRVIKIDIDKNQQAAQQFNIQGVPTLILFKEGKVRGFSLLKLVSFGGECDYKLRIKYIKNFSTNS